MKEKCPRCGEVFSTTGDPSENTGFFVDDVELDKRDGEELSFHLFRSLYKFRRAMLCPKCKRLSLEGEKPEAPREKAKKMFPLIADLQSSKVKAGPRSIPWEIAAIAFGEYSRRGSYKTLEQLAARGGFYWSEMDNFYPEWREKIAVIDELRDELATVKEFLREADEKIKRVREALAVGSSVIAMSSRDWSLSAGDAYLYGLLLGWDDASFEELKSRHNWDEATVMKLKELSLSVQEVKK